MEPDFRSMIPSASHVNAGTAVPRDQLPFPKKPNQPVMTLPKPHLALEDTPPVTLYGGLTLFIAFASTFKLKEHINDNLKLFKQWHPYSEADHVLALSANLFIGGAHLEDLAVLQGSEAVCRMFGACRIPDPTTAGDFLRRFDTAGEKSVESLATTIDSIEGEVWEKLRKRVAKKGKKLPLATVDLDGHIEKELGVQKEKADFSHDGRFGFQPLAITLAQTGEVLALPNRPANGRSSDGVAEELERVLPRLKPFFERILVRGDSDFDRADIRAVCNQHGAHFAFVGRDNRASRTRQAMMIEEGRWQPFRSRVERRKEERRHQSGYRERKKKPNLRRRKARERGYKELYQVRQWVSEVLFEPAGEEATYRMVIRRQLVEHREGQVHMFDEYRYHFIVTDLPRTMGATAVVDETYKRCDQENIIEQLQSGVAAWKMPVAEYLGNCAWLQMARLAWNIGKWIAVLSLPPAVSRWEWKRFRRAFVLVAAQVVKGGRQITTRISRSHRFWPQMFEALSKLQLL